jgi:hypothetical protein
VELIGLVLYTLIFAKSCGEKRENTLGNRNLNLKPWVFGYEAALLVLYGCETWLLTRRQERRQSVFVNRVLRKIFGPKRDEVTGEWRKLHN